MQERIVIGYGIVALAFFIVGIIIGKILKKDVLHGGVELGIINSFLLSVVWPITLLCMISGWGYEAVKTWKKL